MCESAGVHEIQKRTWDALDLELHKEALAMGSGK